MRLLADPQHCPDCGAALPTTDPVCPSCRLDLSGPLGRELFETLSRADALLALLRRRTLPEAPASFSGPVTEPAPGIPAGPVEEPAVQRALGRLSSASVPKILLGLGALCLLVAALVFLAVSWSGMGVGGRTATLVVFTVVAGVLTTWTAGRGLRAAVEALGLVALGLVALDVVGARDAGWVGSPTTPTFAVAVGVLLVAVGLGSAAALARTAARGFTSGELVAVTGAALLSWGLLAGSWEDGALRAVLAVVAAVGLAAVVRLGTPAGRAGLDLAARGLTLVAAMDWLVLLGAGLDRAGSAPSLASVWGQLDGWPLLAAAAIAGGIACASRLDRLERLAALGAAVAALTALATVPAYDEGGTALALACVAAVTAAAAGMALAPRRWAVAGLAALVPASIYLGIAVAVLAGHALTAYVDTAAAAWTGTAAGRLPGLAVGAEQAAAWTLPLATAALLAAGWSAIRVTPLAGRPGRRPRLLLVGGSTMFLALVATLLLHRTPVWAVLAAILVPAATATATGLGLVPGSRGQAARPVALVAGTSAMALGLPLSWYDEWLTLATLAVAVVAAVSVHALGRTDLPAQLAGAVAPPLLGGAVWTAGSLTGVDRPQVALVALLAMAAVAVGRPWLSGGHQEDLVVPVELGSAVAALALGVAGVAAANAATAMSWTAIYLTIGGTAATGMALLRAERRPVGWLGGALLAAATWVRLADLGVSAPEPYTLPSALALLAVGVLHLRRHADASTLIALSPGLALALVPSLLWALQAPLSWRALLLGLGCLALLLIGLRVQWGALLLHAAAVGAVLVLREAAPYVGDSVPRWAVIGAAGALLVALGTTWEQRLLEVRAVAGYLRRLR